MAQQFELKGIKRKGDDANTAIFEFEDETPKNPPSSSSSLPSISSFVSKFWEVKEEKQKQISQMINNFTTTTTTTKETEQTPSRISDTTTNKPDKLEKIDNSEKPEVVFEKVKGRTSAFVDQGGKEVRKITVEEQIIKKGDTKKKALTVTESKKSLLGYLSEKLSKKDLGKGELHAVVKLLLGNEYNVTLDNLPGNSFDSLMDNIKSLHVADKEISTDNPPPPAFTSSPGSTPSFFSIISSIEIISYPPYTCRYVSLRATTSTRTTTSQISPI